MAKVDADMHFREFFATPEVQVPGASRSWDLNFRRCKEFTKVLIDKSEMAKVDADMVLGHGVRFGYVVYSWGAYTKSQVTTDAAKLKTAIHGTKWPMGGTYT